MSKAKPSRVFYADGDDPEMLQASERARDAFRYFWREVAWERRRIIPALDLAAVKAPFSDDDADPATAPGAEHMWLDEIGFDGRLISGKLLNTPNHLKSLKQGDAVRITLEQMSDWMYVIGGEVFGAFTVNVLRSRMDRRKRDVHDDAWGLDFGDPAKVRIMPEAKDATADPLEHPMCAPMTEMLEKQIREDPSFVSEADEQGWTILHQEAMAGNGGTVKVLLDAGANPNAKTGQGMTPRQLAEILGWKHVVKLFENA